jgi:SAM-dependent methyltransferase
MGGELRHGGLRADPAREESELRSYLGSRFEVERLWDYQGQLDAEFAQTADEGVFYRTSTAYLYNLTAFAMTGVKLPYLQELVSHLAPGSRVLDYGCGIGSDGLMLLEAGYRVEFADFDNPSTEYLRWRLARRGHDAAVHDLDVEVPAGFDAAYAFDVIEHCEDPVAFLGEMEQRAGTVAVNFLAPVPGDQELHHELDVRALVRHAARHRLLYYRVHHGRSHLVMYDTGAASPLGRLVSQTRMLAGRVRR